MKCRIRATMLLAGPAGKVYGSRGEMFTMQLQWLH
jgi:hypothetical protein